MRAARDERKVSLRALATQIGWSYVLIGGWERGQTLPKQVQLAAYLGALGVVDDEREQIMSLALNASDPNWLVPGMNADLGAVMEYEQTASKIFSWELAQIPGLLQTSDYARAVFSASRRTPPELRAATLFRIGRAEILNRRDPVTGMFVIGEAALRQRLGSPQAMADQMQHLIDMSERPNVAVRLLPFGDGWHPGLVGLFVLYRFRSESPIVFIEHYRSAGLPYEDRDVADYEAAADTILALALSADDTREALDQARRNEEKR